jgi:hypothetical protein
MIDIEFGDSLWSSALYLSPRVIKGPYKSDHRNKCDKDQYQITHPTSRGLFNNLKYRGSTIPTHPNNSVTVEELQGD